MKKQIRKSILDEAGQTLMSVMVSIGISAVVMLALMQMNSEQSKSMKYFTQKSDLIEFRNQVASAMMNTDVCQWQLLNKELDLTTTDATTASPTIIDFGTTPLYEGLDSLSKVLAEKDKSIFGNSTNLIVEKVSFKDIFATGVPLEYKGIFEIKLKASSTVRSMRPVQVQQVVKVDAVSATSKVLGCSRVTSGSSGCRFCHDTCGGNWPVNGGMADTKDGDWSGSIVLDAGCAGTLNYHPPGDVWKAALCCAN